MIDKALKMMEDLIDGKSNPVEFSIYFADFCFDNYDALEEEKVGVGYLLDQEIPDICDEGEPGFDSAHMIAEITRVYHRVKEMIDGRE